MMRDWDIRTDEPVSSVCVVSYDHAPYIREFLDGVLMQETGVPYEICIGDDG